MELVFLHTLSLAFVFACVPTCAWAAQVFIDASGQALGITTARVKATMTTAQIEERTSELQSLWDCQDMLLKDCRNSSLVSNGVFKPKCICEVDVWKVIAGLDVVFAVIGFLGLAVLIWFTSAAGDQMSTDAMELRLSKVKTEGYLRRLRISGPPTIIGLALIGFAIPNYLLYPPVLNIYISMHPTSFAGFLVLISAMLPTDRRMIYTIASVLMVLGMWHAIITVFKLQRISENKTLFGYGGDIYYRLACQTTEISMSLLLFLYISYHVCMSPTRRLLNRLWICAGARSLVWALEAVYISVLKFHGATSYRALSWPVLPYFFILSSLNALAGLHPALRRGIRQWLTSKSVESAAAAGVAELLSNRDPADVLEQAQASFLCVPANCLTREDMAKNTPDQRLHEYTQRATLGSVDAFMSHSWHDDAEAKWNCLQSWREQFKKEHDGMEPTLWIDKYCLDQDNIDDSLACLPIYLAGCKKLLVLCGNTYLERLWCVVELFVFMEMQGDSSNFEARIFGNREYIAPLVQDFEVNHARCFTEEDTHRLMEVIAAGGAGLIRQLDTFVKDNFQ